MNRMQKMPATPPPVTSGVTNALSNRVPAPVHAGAYGVSVTFDGGTGGGAGAGFGVFGTA